MLIEILQDLKKFVSHQSVCVIYIFSYTRGYEQHPFVCVCVCPHACLHIPYITMQTISLAISQNSVSVKISQLYVELANCAS